MEISSEYSFPIFISSTDYNLIDLRAELARYLRELGYRPILSSSEGFPDSFPDLEPWESCLPVLESCFVVILVIDGRYGTILDWPNFKPVFGDRKLSPTHAEYVFAHKIRKRMLVFIRRDVLSYYQNYRIALQQANNNKDEAKTLLDKTLPGTVSFETLQFIEEVKTNKPIPWIKPFEDVTLIKQEIQKKMLNELAEVFLIKNKHLETVVHAFSRVMDELAPEKRKQLLQSIGVTRELIETMEIQTKTVESLRQQEIKLKAELDAAHTDIEKGKKTVDEKKALEAKVTELTRERNRLEKEITKHEQAKTSFILGDKTVPSSSSGLLGSSVLGLSAGLTNSPIDWLSSTVGKKCDGCGTYDITGSVFGIRTCNNCHKQYCLTCWPLTLSFVGPDLCPGCRQNPYGVKPTKP